MDSLLSQPEDLPVSAKRVKRCGLGECTYETARAGHLRSHQASKHGIGGKYPCDVKGCTAKPFATASELTRHKARTHGEGERFRCGVNGCKYETTRACDLRKHQASQHGIGGKYPCDVEGCTANPFATASALAQHKARTHGEGERFRCDECTYETTEAGHLRRHKMFKHNLDVTWHVCGVNGCTDKFKTTGELRKHQSYIHDIDVTWHKCDVGECKHKFKTAGDLMRHIETHHNADYVARKKEQEERVRKVLLGAGYKQCYKSAAIPPIGQFTREHMINFRCESIDAATKFAKIDFVLSLPNGLVFLEVDENQHKYGYDGLVSCDLKRMGQVMQSLTIEAKDPDALPHIYWLRYNPHAWRVGGELQKCLKVDREKWLVDWLSKFEPTAPMGIGYAYYDADEEGCLEVLENEHYHEQYAEIAQNLTPTLV